MTPASLSEDLPSPSSPAAPACSRWLIVFGGAVAVLGALAFGHLSVAAVVSTFVIGAVILIGGALQIGHALAMRSLGFGHDWGMGGVFYLLAGLAILFEPVAGASLFILFLALFLAISGVSRLVIGARPGGRWMLASGVVSIMAGTVIAMDWPANSLWVMGFMVAFDLVTLGVALMGTGFALRRLDA